MTVQYARWPDRAYYTELLRPWKLTSFGIAMTWLLYGALTYHIPDWDVGITLIMGGFTYLCAPWCTRIMLDAIRFRRRGWVVHIVVALLVAWFVVDGVYWAYHTAVGNQLFRLDNFKASMPLFFLAGTVWLYRGSLRDLFRNILAILK